MTAALHFRALDALPAPLAALISAHAFADELQELVQEAALALTASPGDSVQAIYGRARSNVRRFSQDLAHYARGIDGITEAEATAEQIELPAAKLTRKQARARIEADLGISTSAARRLLKKQLERMRENGDLFAGDESESGGLV